MVPELLDGGLVVEDVLRPEKLEEASLLLDLDDVIFEVVGSGQKFLERVF